jgi:hypothetical protein
MLLRELITEKRNISFAGKGQKTGTAGQLRGRDKVDVKGTVLGSPEKSQKGLRGKLVGGAMEDVHDSEDKPDFMDMMEKFLPICMKELDLPGVPHIKLVKNIGDTHQPTFGKFENDTETITLGLANRHPLDVLRTLAHELTHFKQNTEHRIDDNSGETGSPEENEAHARAGIIMRHFGKAHPNYFNSKPLMAEEASSGGTSAGNVSVGAIYANKTAKKQSKGKGKVAPNALDGDNLITGGSLIKR